MLSQRDLCRACGAEGAKLKVIVFKGGNIFGGEGGVEPCIVAGEIEFHGEFNDERILEVGPEGVGVGKVDVDSIFVDHPSGEDIIGRQRRSSSSKQRWTAVPF